VKQTLISNEDLNQKLPARFNRLSADSLKITEGGGGISLFGIPFLGAGVLLFLAATKVIPFDNADEIDWWVYPIIFIMATAFTCVGGGLVFGRKWYALDRARGTFVVSWGLLLPMKHEEKSLRLYDTIELEYSPGDSDSPDQYPVSLKGRGATKPVRLVDGRDYGSARRGAVYLAEYLGLPLEDATTDHSVRLKPDELHRTYRESTRQDSPTGVGQPLHMKSKVERGDGQLTISIPPPSRTAATLFPPVVLVIVGFIFGPDLFQFFDKTDTPEEIKLFAMGFATLLALIVFIGALRAWKSSKRPAMIVTLNNDTLTIDDRSGRRNKSTSIATKDMLGLDYSTREFHASPATTRAVQTKTRYGSGDPRLATSQLSPESSRVLTWIAKYVPSKGITVKSTHGMHSFGEGLPDEEVRYLHYIISEYLRE
jgi:hypothetical protein